MTQPYVREANGLVHRVWRAETGGMYGVTACDELFTRSDRTAMAVRAVYTPDPPTCFACIAPVSR